MAPIIEARALTKHYRRVRALDGFDLVAEEGRVVAVLGPNGAGKTTFVRTVATLTRPDSGTLRVAGIDAVADPARVRRLIGLAGQSAAVEPTMTGRENLQMVGRLFGLDRDEARAATSRVLCDFGLDEAADRPVRTYSGGMRRRVDLGASMVGSPRLLLLDEPTTGLDPRSRIELWESIRTLVARGTDVLLTTQYLDEADQLATDVVIVDRGRVVAAGTPAELKNKVGSDVVELHVREAQSLAAAQRALTAIGSEPARVDLTTKRVSVTVQDGSERLQDALRALDDTAVVIDDIRLRRPTLDEVFLALTGSETT
ncbi:MAG: ATP-binding cassette domain-containing protein [Acidimicrobiia bacterium]